MALRAGSISRVRPDLHPPALLQRRTLAASGPSWSLPSAVPGGVGPMTRAMLLYNTLRAAEIRTEMTQEASTGGPRPCQIMLYHRRWVGQVETEGGDGLAA